MSDPTNSALQNFLMWDLGTDRVVNRNMPYVEVTNDSPSNAVMTEFRMTIGDSRFHFDCEMLKSCAMQAKSTSDLSLTFGSSVANGGDELVLAFGNGGLKPGEVIRFKIALGVDDGYDFYHRPDFRTVLFDMNGVNVYDGNLHNPSSVDPTADNSHMTAKFELGGVSGNVGPIAFDDFTIIGNQAVFYNNNYRPYGVMEPIDTFLALGAGEVIPEPGSLVLLTVGLLAGAVPLARSRRRS